MRKQNVRRAACALLAAVTAVMALSGCGAKEEGQGTTGAPGQTASGKPAEGMTELKIHFHSNNKYTIADSDGNILPVFGLAAEKTNVRLVNTANPVAQNSGEEFQLQATEKFPADIYGGNSLKGPIYT